MLKLATKRTKSAPKRIWFFAGAVSWMAAALGIIVLSWVGAASIRTSGPYLTAPNGEIIRLEIADTLESKAKGLSGRSSLSPDAAMLFVFDRPGYYGFWMKEMRVSIDMVWLDARSRVVTIHRNVHPNTYPQSFSSREPAQYVLEFPAGRTQELGIEEGSTITWKDQS